jgi:type VI secretion system secreted protein VgrG
MEVRVVDENGDPVRNKRYRLILPSGEVRDGTLDGDGKAKLENVPPGRVRLAVDVRE